MEFEFDPAKDEANRFKHGLRLDFGIKVFEAEDHVILPSLRDEDAEERYKAVGLVDGKLYTAVHTWRDDVVRIISVSETMRVNEETTIAIPADPNDPEDFDVSIAGLKRGLMGREVRLLRRRLGMSQDEFAKAYGIPVSSIRQYEIGRHMPPPAVRAYLKAISVEPEAVRRALTGEAAKAFDIRDVKAA